MMPHLLRDIANANESNAITFPLLYDISNHHFRCQNDQGKYPG